MNRRRFLGLLGTAGVISIIPFKIATPRPVDSPVCIQELPGIKLDRSSLVVGDLWINTNDSSLHRWDGERFVTVLPYEDYQEGSVR